MSGVREVSSWTCQAHEDAWDLEHSGIGVDTASDFVDQENGIGEKFPDFVAPLYGVQYGGLVNNLAEAIPFGLSFEPHPNLDFTIKSGMPAKINNILWGVG